MRVREYPTVIQALSDRIGARQWRLFLTMTNNVASRIAPITSIDETWTINEVVERFPSTLPMLSAIGVDTCCGGAHTLATAAAHKKLDLEVFLRELDAVACGRSP